MTPSGEPVLSFVLLNHNNSDYTLDCIRSIQQTLKVPHEIIVVDNASRDKSMGVLSGVDGIVLIKNEKNRGFTGGNNDGARIAKGRNIVILNNDTTVFESNLDELPAILDELGPYDVVGGRLYGVDGKAQTSGGYEPTFLHFVFQFTVFCYKFFHIPGLRWFWLSDFSDSGTIEVDWASGCFFAMRLESYRELGGFDEGIFIYLDEVDLHKRARARGGKILLNPRLRILHYGGVTWKAKSHISLMHNYNSAVHFIRKHHNRAKSVLFVFLVKCSSILCLPLLTLASVLTLFRVRKLNSKLRICWFLLIHKAHTGGGKIND